MTIPDYESIMLPLLKFAGDEKPHSLKEAIDYIAKHFRLTEEELRVLLPSGKQLLIDNRVGWARTYMKKAGLLESPARTIFKITQRGIDVLKENNVTLNSKYLKKYPEFLEFQTSAKIRTKTSEAREDSAELSQTPQEMLDEGYRNIQENLSKELLENIKKCSPAFFERLVVDLLLAMGYGGSRKDAGQAIGKSGDEGIDGIIKEDRLGLDVIYLQAKRWENSVGRPEIQKFVGSLAGQKAAKGVFITTSWFTDDAIEFVRNISVKIILIDGEFLTSLMIENDIGVSKVTSYDVKKIDSDYFEEY